MTRYAFLMMVTIAAAAAGPILVSGSGTFSYDGMDGSTVLSFSGSDGIHSVFVGAEQSACCGPTFGSSPSQPFGSAGVDGISFLPGNPDHTFRFSLGDSGFVALYDHGTQVAFESIAGYVVITSFNDPGCCGFYRRSGTFAIIPTPEPATLGLLGAGLSLIMVLRKLFGSGNR